MCARVRAAAAAREVESLRVSLATEKQEKTAAKLAWSLLLPTAFSFGADILGDYELNEVWRR